MTTKPTTERIAPDCTLSGGNALKWRLNAGLSGADYTGLNQLVRHMRFLLISWFGIRVRGGSPISISTEVLSETLTVRVSNSVVSPIRIAFAVLLTWHEPRLCSR
jgi:hypothetical protein